MQLARIRSIARRSYSDVKSSHEVGRPGHDVLELEIRQRPVAVYVALLQNLPAHGSNLLGAQATSSQLPAGAFQVAETQQSVLVEIYRDTRSHGNRSRIDEERSSFNGINSLRARRLSRARTEYATFVFRFLRAGRPCNNYGTMRANKKKI